MGEDEMDEIAALVHRMLTGFDDDAVRAEVRHRSRALCRRFPLPYRDAPPA
jgi:glycine/serine hydroxymethyltransferase